MAGQLDQSTPINALLLISLHSDISRLVVLTSGRLWETGKFLLLRDGSLSTGKRGGGGGRGVL